MASPNHAFGNGGEMDQSSGLHDEVVKSREAACSTREPAKYRGAVDEVLRAMAHPVRRDVLLTLADGKEMSASELGRAIGLDGSRLADVAYQVKYLAQRGCIEQTRIGVGKRGSTVIRFYRINGDYSTLLGAIANLETQIKDRPVPAADAPPVEAPAPRLTRLQLGRALCSCSNSLPDEDGCCINCTKNVAGALA